MTEITYTVQGEEHTLNDIGYALYHIANNTQVSQGYTLKYVHEVLSVAASYLCGYEVDSGPHYYLKTSEALTELISSYWEKHEEHQPIQVYPDVCEYHGARHTECAALHPCPADDTKECICCGAGVNHCLRKGPTAL